MIVLMLVIVVIFLFSSLCLITGTVNRDRDLANLGLFGFITSLVIYMGCGLYILLS